MAKIDVQTFDKWVTALGAHAAGEVLLLAVTRVCGDDSGLWTRARALGIPWQHEVRHRLFGELFAPARQRCRPRSSHPQPRGPAPGKGLRKASRAL